MLARDFYNVITDETTATAFLRRNGLLDEVDDVAPCHRCGGKMKETRRKGRNGEIYPTLRCKVRGCQTFRSIRNGNDFFHYTDLNNRVVCKLSLCQILELIFYFVQDISYDSVHELTGRGTEAIRDWFTMCYEICSQIVSINNCGLGTKEEPVLIDEARFVGRKKHNRGRMMQGDPVTELNDYFCWCAMRKNSDLFLAFLADIRSIYRQN